MAGYLGAYRRDFCCADIYYRGTAAHPGLTLGVVPTVPTGVVPGVVQQYDVRSLDAIVDNLAAFAERESPRNMPIYRFELVDIGTATASMRALTSLADVRSSLYRPGLSLHEQAVIIATSASAANLGSPSAQPVGGTDLNYLRRFVASLRTSNIDELASSLAPAEGRRVRDAAESERGHFESLLREALLARAALDLEQRTELERRDAAERVAA